MDSWLPVVLYRNVSSALALVGIICHDQCLTVHICITSPSSASITCVYFPSFIYRVAVYRPAINDVEVNGVALLDSGHSSTMIGLNKNRTEKGHPVLMQDWARAEQTAEMRRIAYFDTPSSLDAGCGSA